MEEQLIKMDWHPRVGLSELAKVEKEKIGCPGIYVWGWFDEEEKFVPYYVGKANNIGQRLFEHIGKLKGGLYAIYSKEFAFSKGFHPLMDQDDELLYIPSGIENWINNFQKTNVQESLNWLLEKIKFSWCITKKENNTDLERYTYNLFNSKPYKVGASVRGKCREGMKVEFTGDEVLVNLCK